MKQDGGQNTVDPFDIVYFSVNSWESIRQREQQLALAMSKSHRVIYVEAPQSVVGFAAALAKSQRSIPNDRLRKIHDLLYVYTPSVALPFSLRSNLTNYLNNLALFKKVKSVLEKLASSNYVVGTGRPSLSSLPEYFSNASSYYDCMDDHSSFPTLRISKNKIIAREAALMKSVDSIFVSSEALLDRVPAGKPVYVVKNACEFEYFYGASIGSGHRPAELSNLASPIIGYFGTIAPWFDVESVEWVAAQRRDWHFVLIGPQELGVNLERLRRLPNVQLLGPKSYEELVPYLACFDICLIPFKKGKLIEYVNPTKMYEYFAAGKPVVSSEIPEVLHMGDLVGIYRNGPQLERVIVETLRSSGDTEKKRMRIAVAERNQWSTRAEAMLDVVRRDRLKCRGGC